MEIKFWNMKISDCLFVDITSNAGDEVVEALHIRNASLKSFNITLPAWRRLKYMSITDGQIQEIVGEFAKYSHVSCLNLSSNGIRKVEQRSLVNLYNLSYLDLSHNNLTDIPRFKKEGAVTLDIRGKESDFMFLIGNIPTYGKLK